MFDRAKLLQKLLELSRTLFVFFFQNFPLNLIVTAMFVRSKQQHRTNLASTTTTTTTATATATATGTAKGTGTLVSGI